MPCETVKPSWTDIDLTRRARRNMFEGTIRIDKSAVAISQVAGSPNSLFSAARLDLAVLTANGLRRRKSLIMPKQIQQIVANPLTRWSNDESNFLWIYLPQTQAAYLIATFSPRAAVGFSRSSAAQPLQLRSTQHVDKKRLILLTDICAEADDTESTVRLLLYSDVIDIEGLIATTSVWKSAPSPELIRQLIGAYAQVHGNLVKNDPNFPPSRESSDIGQARPACLRNEGSGSRQGFKGVRLDHPDAGENR